jgi:uncharacterized protein (DUF58 family)
MLVPRTSLLIIIAVLVVPSAALTALQDYAGLGYGLIAGVAIFALIDAMISRRMLDELTVLVPGTVRMWQNREESFDLIIRHQRKLRMELRIALSFPAAVRAQAEEAPIVLPADAEQSRLTWNCTPVIRGRYAIDLCAVETPSKLRLWDIRRRYPIEIDIRIYPDVAAGVKNSAAFLKRGLTGARPQRQIGRGREFEKLRDYSPGDGFDEIDWKATARRARPITRVFQVEKTQEVYVVLDASRLLARKCGDDGPETILDRNITATLLLAVQAQKQGDLFGLITFSDRVHSFVRARNGKAHYGSCRDALYRLQPRIVTPDFDEVCAQLRLRLRKRALLVFLTELDDPVVAESFIRTVNLLRTRHVVLVAMNRPGGAHPLFEGEQPADLQAIYAGLAGHQRWRKLRELSAILESQGVRFSLFEPKRMAGDLAASYLSLKQRQVL